MRFIKLLLFLFVVFILTGCVHTAKKESWTLNFNETNPAPCCDAIVDRLLSEYPPAKITLSLSKSENLNFDTLLESKVRKAGYKISQTGEAIKISYIIDIIEKNVAYIHLKSSDGLVFNRMFQLSNYYFYSNSTEKISEAEK